MANWPDCLRSLAICCFEENDVDISLKSIAHILGGEFRGNQVLAPGPGHSREDRSLSITISDSGDDIVVHSFAHDDPITCKDYVREKCGIQFKPNGKQRVSEADIERAVMMDGGGVYSTKIKAGGDL